MKSSIAALVIISNVLAMLSHSSVHATSIVSISSPVGSDDAQSHSSDDNVWEVSAPPFPFDSDSGIGYLINPAYPTAPTSVVQSDFSRHDHVYTSSRVPDPTRAVVTYQFSSPVVVDQLEVIQHQNGITQLEAFAGNSPGSLSSIGSIFGPGGDITTANALTEGSSEIFDFDNAIPGTYFQFIVRKTNETDGWATYRAFPRLADGMRIPAAVPEPSSMAILTVLLGGLTVCKFHNCENRIRPR